MAPTAHQLAGWMRHCYRAAVSSPDRFTQNYAVVVTYDAIERLQGAYNGLVRGQDPGDPRNHERPLKYSVTSHAERRAIFRCAAGGHPTQGAILVTPWAPCPVCAEAIVESGFSRLVVHWDAMARTPDRWVKEVQLGLKIVTDAGVNVTQLKGHLDAGVKIRFDGQQIDV